jgi:hypothetical protein
MFARGAQEDSGDSDQTGVLYDRVRHAGSGGFGCHGGLEDAAHFEIPGLSTKKKQYLVSIMLRIQ